MQADADDLFDLFRNDIPVLRHEERSDSSLSLASTVPSPTIYIKAFCVINELYITIEFPDPDNGWVYRYDMVRILSSCSADTPHAVKRSITNLFVAIA